MDNQNYTNMSAQQLGSQAMTALQDPSLQQATDTFNKASGSYQQQLGDTATLPQLLSNSLNSSLDNPSDPVRQQEQSDLSGLLTAASNPSDSIGKAASIIPGAILSPGAQDQAIAENIGNRGAAVSMDNTIFGARGMGISNILNAYSNFMAGRTQQLLAGVNQAAQNRDYLWNKAQSLGQMAMQLAQFKQNADQFEKNYGLEQQRIGIEGGQLKLAQNAQAFEQSHNATDLANTARKQMGQDAAHMTVNQFINKYRNDPRLPGITPGALYSEYQRAGGKQQPTDQDYNEFPDLNAGSPGGKVKANIKNMLAYPQAIGSMATDILGNPQGALGIAGMLGGEGSLASEIGGIASEVGGGLGALLGLL